MACPVWHSDVRGRVRTRSREDTDFCGMWQKKRIQCSLPPAGLALNMRAKRRARQGAPGHTNCLEVCALVTGASRWQWAGPRASQAALGLVAVPVSSWALHAHAHLSDTPGLVGGMMVPSLQACSTE